MHACSCSYFINHATVIHLLLSKFHLAPKNFKLSCVQLMISSGSPLNVLHFSSIDMYIYHRRVCHLIVIFANKVIVLLPFVVTIIMISLELTVLCAGVLLSPVIAQGSSTVLTDPGPFCFGQTAVLTCNVTEGVSIRWSYDGSQFGGLITPSQPPSPDPMLVFGVELTLSLLEDTGSDLVSQLSFTASADVSGEVVSCVGISPTGPGGDREVSQGVTTLQVVQMCKNSKGACTVIWQIFYSRNYQLISKSLENIIVMC